MATNFFKSLSNRIKTSPWIIPIYFLFLLGLYISIRLLIEDFGANFGAYETIPTNKAYPNTVLWMAIGLQIAPLFFFVIFLFDDENPIKFATSFLFLLVDWGIGIYFRNPGVGTGWLIYSAVEDLVFFTAGSEVLFTISIGMLASLFLPFWKQVANVFGTLMSGKDDAIPQLSRGFQPNKHIQQTLKMNKRSGPSPHRPNYAPIAMKGNIDDLSDFLRGMVNKQNPPLGGRSDDECDFFQ